MPKSAVRRASIILAASISGISLVLAGCGNPTETADSAITTQVEKAGAARDKASTPEDLSAVQALYDSAAVAAKSPDVSTPTRLLARGSQAQLRYQQTLDLISQLRSKELDIHRTINAINALASQVAGSQKYVQALQSYDPSTQIDAIKSKQADIGGDASKPQWTLTAPTPDDATASLKFPTLTKLTSFIDTTTAAIAKSKADIDALHKQSADATDQAETLTRKSESEIGQALLDDQTKASNLRKDAAIADAQADTLAAQQALLQADLDTATAQKTATDSTNQSLDAQIAARQANWKGVQNAMADEQKLQQKLIVGGWDAPAEGWASEDAKPASIQQLAGQLGQLLVDAGTLRDKVDSELSATISQFQSAESDATQFRRDLQTKIGAKVDDPDNAIWKDEMETLNPSYFTLQVAAAKASQAEVSANKTTIDFLIGQMFDGCSVKPDDVKAPLDSMKLSIDAPTADTALLGLTQLLDKEKTGIDVPKEVSDLPRLSKDQIQGEVDSVNQKFQDVLDTYNKRSAATDTGPAAVGRNNAALMGRATTERQWADFDLLLGIEGADTHLKNAISLENSVNPPKPETPATPAVEGGAAPTDNTTPTTPATPAGANNTTPTTPPATPGTDNTTPTTPAATPPATPAAPDNTATPAAPATQPAAQ